uniref:Uncharacterized protein n=1 Tax=Manihot esculenta TaxID=3983 RepID=A0A2C9V1U1_MANES
MGCLINTASDAGYLRDHGIIENYFGTDDEVVKYFNEVGKDVLFSVKRSYLAKVFEEVNKYYKNTWHVRWAEFKYTYFGSPWIFISALAAFILLLLTILCRLWLLQSSLIKLPILLVSIRSICIWRW